ncbi:CMRF35-like molecule 7 [Arapaima gigas]
MVWISFKYHSFYLNHVKYWCRGYYWNYCQVLRRSDEKDPPDSKLKVWDDKGNLTFTVTMTDLKAEDSGWYWCAIERVSYHVKVSLELKVSKGRPTSRPALTTSQKPTTTIPTTTPERTTTSPTTLFSTVTASTVGTTGTLYHPLQGLPGLWLILRWVLFGVLALIFVLFQVLLSRCCIARKNRKKKAVLQRRDYEHLELRVMDPSWTASRQQKGAPALTGASTRKGASALKGVPTLKAASTKKGVPTLKGTTSAKGTRTPRGASTLNEVPTRKGASAPKGVPTLKGTSTPKGVTSAKGASGLKGVSTLKGASGLREHRRALTVSVAKSHHNTPFKSTS